MQAGDLTAAADDVRLAGAQIAGDVAVMGLPGRFGHQHADILAEQRTGRIAKQVFGRRVDRFDGAGFVDDDDAIHGSLKDAVAEGLGLFQG